METVLKFLLSVYYDNFLQADKILKSIFDWRRIRLFLDEALASRADFKSAFKIYDFRSLLYKRTSCTWFLQVLNIWL